MSLATIKSNLPARLSELETVIERGQQTFIEVGNALAEIRDSRLYRETHKTFEAYCQERWNWSRVQAHRFIKAADTAEHLLPMGNKPTSERQIRPLTKLKTTDEQYEAWRRANEISADENKPVTGEIVQRAVSEIKPTTVQLSDCRRSVAESHADKAISWVNEIDLTKPGAYDAITKVVSHCKKLLKGVLK